eukprot:gene17822-19601_t
MFALDRTRFYSELIQRCQTDVVVRSSLKGAALSCRIILMLVFPTISCALRIEELTPSIVAVLQVVHEDNNSSKCKDNNNAVKCPVCDRSLDSLIKQALTPIKQQQQENMQQQSSTSLPRNFSLQSSTSARGKQLKEDDVCLLQSVKSYIKTIDAQFTSNTIQRDMSESADKINPEDQSESELSSTTSASSFFYRAAQRFSLSSKRRNRKSRRKTNKDCDAESTSASEHGAFPTNFADLIMRCPPQAPPSLFKHVARKTTESNGKVKVMLRVSDKDDNNAPSCLKLDPKKKQAYLCDIRDPNVSPRLGKEAKLYQFDSMFDAGTTNLEMCSSTLVDLLQTVVNYGEDASFVSYGHSNLGKSKAMIGEDDSCENLGIIPCAISWLYQLIEDRKERTGARFSVRVSAIEVVGKSENLKDLLTDQASGSINNCSTSPSLYLQRERTGQVQFADFTELRAPSAEKASFYFDSALASRTSTKKDEANTDSNEDASEKENSNMIFTFHVYQYLIDKVGTGEIHGGRSRFHLIDLSGCKRAKRSKDPQGSWLSLSNLGSVLVALANGTKHIPHRDSKLTVLLREAFGTLSSRIALTAFVSGNPKKYTETLSTMEVTTRIHRSRRKKSRYSSGSSGGDSSCDEARGVRRRPKPVQPMFVTRACESETMGDSEFTTSAAEDSCDTVIYVGPKGQPVSDAELTDFERPPSPNAIEIASNNCIHTTEMKNVDTGYKSELSLLASFSDQIDRSSSSATRRSTTSCSLSNEGDLISYDISDDARKALDHPSTPYYYLIPGSPRSDSNGILNNFVQRRNRPCFNSYRGKRSPSSPKLLSSSQDNVNTTTTARGRRNSREELPPSRTVSLDRYFTRNEQNRNDYDDDDNYNNTDEFSHEHCTTSCNHSIESIASSQQTVCEFERDLVSKIVERFDVEQEIVDMEPELISSYLQKEEASLLNGLDYDDDDDDYRSRRLSTDSSIIVTVTSQERLDPSYIDSLNLTDTLRRQREASLSEFLSSQNASDERPDSSEPVQPWEPRLDFSKDSTAIENYTSKDGRGTACRLDSASSCGSLLAIPKAVGLASEGVSSGYESMRCESSGNLNTVSDLDSEQRKYKSNKKDRKSQNKGKDRKDNDTPSIPESGIFSFGCAFDRSRFGKGKSHKKDVKTLISERKSMKESLQQVLQRLVLLKDPVSDVDAHDLCPIRFDCRRDNALIFCRCGIVQNAKSNLPSSIRITACPLHGACVNADLAFGSAYSVPLSHLSICGDV